MEKLFDKIKSRPIITLCIVGSVIVILTVGIPIGIHALFKTPALGEWFIPKWEAGNVLEYYGAILSFLGTAALSALALYQNYEIKKEADAKQREKELPYFRIKNSTCNGNYSNLGLLLTNISENVAYDINVNNFKAENDLGEIIVESTEVKLQKVDLLGNETIEIKFKNRGLFGNNIKIIFEMRCKDKNYNMHTYNVSLKVDDAKIFTSKRLYRIIEI